VTETAAITARWCERNGIGSPRQSSVDRIGQPGVDESEVVGRILRHASDHLYLQVPESSMRNEDFAAVDLLDDLRAEMGVL
jgi:hypothetical protein